MFKWSNIDTRYEAHDGLSINIEQELRSKRLYDHNMSLKITRKKFSSVCSVHVFFAQSLNPASAS